MYNDVICVYNDVICVYNDVICVYNDAICVYNDAICILALGTIKFEKFQPRGLIQHNEYIYVPLSTVYRLCIY